MKKLAIFALLPLTITTLCCGSGGTNRITLRESVDRSVVVTTGDKSFCSGVILTTGIVVTAKHCKSEHMFVDGHAAALWKESLDDDLILLKAPTRQVSLVRFATPDVADTVYGIANQSDYLNLYTSGEVVGFGKNNTILVRTLSAPGVSGSGVYDRSGALVGVSVQMYGTFLSSGAPIILCGIAIQSKRVAQLLGPLEAEQ